ncbi:MAG: hypothetical protein AB1454_02765 [Candidatus Auribacterota bacterium]
MLHRYPVSADKNTSRNFDSIFNHVNRYYLGSLTDTEISRINTSDLPFGAMVYNRTAHTLAVLTDADGDKVFRPLLFQI